ncbi:hypothetical protein SNE25_02610 [Mucilaginibacter sabulilitoris]|uniref:Response regulatory domain-containing protein n=1 Tax=Mucilaginibacter sabulilitoris TaxID=1173583 RepID=A0ABZ0TML8_9SPHI|nr:hypothetical protein [Mucilaginibacter sabulilitoris]WPU94412.1 hypothetical protein SNE25_02610 [Mucilaginibacter sabulilitoris]
MISARSKNVLLVAPDNFSVELFPEKKMFRHLSAVNSIFPTIHELKPNLVIFDYDHVNKDIEKILRRMTSNPAYKKIKICCYKNTSHTKTDGLLKALGVDYIFYQDDLKKSVEGKNASSIFSTIFEMPIINLLARASH